MMIQTGERIEGLEGVYHLIDTRWGEYPIRAEICVRVNATVYEETEYEPGYTEFDGFEVVAVESLEWEGPETAYDLDLVYKYVKAYVDRFVEPEECEWSI